MKHFSSIVLLLIAGSLFSGPVLGQTYNVDPVHSSAIFRIKHANTGYVWGRFNDPAGTFVLDADAAKSAFAVEIQAANVDTHQEKRDAHLRSPDFLNAKQYPVISFKSMAVKKIGEARLEVTGNLMLHGVTKPITAVVEITGSGEFPKGTPRVGIEATFTIKTSDFEIKGLPGVVGEEVRLIVALEGIKQ